MNSDSWKRALGAIHSSPLKVEKNVCRSMAIQVVTQFHHHCIVGDFLFVWEKTVYTRDDFTMADGVNGVNLEEDIWTDVKCAITKPIMAASMASQINKTLGLKPLG